MEIRVRPAFSSMEVSQYKRARLLSIHSNGIHKIFFAPEASLFKDTDNQRVTRSNIIESKADSTDRGQIATPSSDSPQRICGYAPREVLPIQLLLTSCSWYVRCLNATRLSTIPFACDSDCRLRT
jgi:hypothetical protein